MTISNTTRGILCAAVACAFFTMFDGTTKFLVGRYPVFEVMAFTFSISAVLVLLWARISLKEGFAASVRLEKTHLHVLRGLCQFVSNGLFAFSFMHLSLSEFYVILFLAPLLIALLSGWLLGEKPSLLLSGVLVVSFAGVLIALRPAAGFNMWALVAVGGMMMNAITSMLLRKMAATETAISPAYSAGVIVGLLCGAISLFNFKMPTLHDAGLLFLGGVLYAFGQLFFVRAFRYAPAPFAASAQFLQLPYGMVVGFILFGDVPSLAIFLGGAIVIAANLYLLYMQNRKAMPS